MRERDLYGKQLTIKTAEQIKVASERLFAVAFLNYFGLDIPLTYQPNAIHVPGLGMTAPDFSTPFRYKDRLLLEVTETQNTMLDDHKRTQYGILEAHHVLCPEDFYLEINGRALYLPDYLMMSLEAVYEDRMKVYEAQKEFNRLGCDHAFFLSVMARALV